MEIIQNRKEQLKSSFQKRARKGAQLSEESQKGSLAWDKIRNKVKFQNRTRNESVTLITEPEIRNLRTEQNIGVNFRNRTRNEA